MNKNEVSFNVLLIRCLRFKVKRNWSGKTQKTIEVLKEMTTVAAGGVMAHLK